MHVTLIMANDKEGNAYPAAIVEDGDIDKVKCMFDGLGCSYTGFDTKELTGSNGLPLYEVSLSEIDDSSIPFEMTVNKLCPAMPPTGRPVTAGYTILPSAGGRVLVVRVYACTEKLAIEYAKGIRDAINACEFMPLPFNPSSPSRI